MRAAASTQPLGVLLIKGEKLMDENVNNNRDIVASNLTVAYCANREESFTEEQIIEIYQRFIGLLKPKGDRYSEEESQSWGTKTY